VRPSKRYGGAPDERRDASRYPTVDNRARLGWWEAETFRESAARVGDVSQGGALVFVESPPPPDAPVWLLLEEPVATSWVPAIVVRSRGTAAGSHALGLQFHDCPYELFKALRGLLSRAVVQESPEFDSRQWR
jgi:hypothetical protein